MKEYEYELDKKNINKAIKKSPLPGETCLPDRQV